MSKESAYFNISNLNGKHGLKQIKRELDAIPGVISVSVNTENHRVAVDFDNTGVTHSQIEKSLCKQGFEITADSGEDHIM